LLRAHDVADLPACVAMWSDENVTRFIGGRPSSRQQSWARILTYAGHWRLLGFGYWAIEEKASRRFVGEVGFADFKRDVDAWAEGTPEVGFALAPQFQRKGYAGEALRAALAWADANFSHDRTVCLIHPDNAASIRVATNAGYQILKAGEYNEKPVLFYDRMRPLTPR
jgi:RimJ/RimL family protein N-acetyltransferase